MRVILCPLQMYIIEQTIYVYDWDKKDVLSKHTTDINNLAKTVCALAGELDINEVRLVVGNKDFWMPWAEEIKTVYSLNYGNNNINVEVI